MLRLRGKDIDLVAQIFEAIDIGLLQAITSEITLLETLVIPLRNSDTDLALKYEELLSESRGLTLIDLDRNLLYKAADIRAKYTIKTPDALQIAACLQEQCSVFVTNDRRLPQIPGLKILHLENYL